MPKKPSKSEAEYIARQEQHRAKLGGLEHEQAAQEQERRRHYMKCPKCGGQLASELFRTVEIDRCADCGGVWLDPGELGKLAGRDSHFFGDLFAFLRGSSG